MRQRLSPQDIAGIGMTSQRTRDRLVERLRAKGIGDESVLATIASVPRHLFVDEAMASHAYEDKALPIGHRQTISQPFVVARMTEALLADGIPDKVLELGTGSGYQAAVLSRLVPQVYTVERIRELHLRARDLVAGLGYRNVHCRYADGAEGWPAQAPFDAIIAKDRIQQLQLIRRQGGEFHVEVLDQVSFVPFLPGMQ